MPLLNAIAPVKIYIYTHIYIFNPIIYINLIGQKTLRMTLWLVEELGLSLKLDDPLDTGFSVYGHSAI